MTYTKCGSKNKPIFLRTATAEQIQGHTDKVRQGLDPCCLSPCPRCGVTPDFFKRHEKRSRIFYIIVDLVVTTFRGLLARWKCPGCNKTATSYPDFALPYKRFTLPTLQSLSQPYVQDPSASYRKIVATCPLVYEMPSESDSNREPMMEHSTIHRWISTMGCYSRLVQNATDFIIQADPATRLCRDLAGLKISPDKYRSLSRKQTLLTCFHLVFLMPFYRTVFQTGIFPKLATLSGYT
jgi:rubredoxin